MKNQKLLLTFLAAALTGGVSPAHADVKHNTIRTSGTTSTCSGLTRPACIRKHRGSGYPFGVALRGDEWFKIETIWVRVRKADGSRDKTLVTHKKNLSADWLGLIQFHPDDVAKAFGWSLEQLQDRGFQVRAKIESQGAGSGRQDKCPVFSFSFDDSSQDWTYAKGSSPTASNFKSVKEEFTIHYEAKGTVNDVKCGFTEIVEIK